jgi:glycosyltransferase involved in cell wall biosynthesis
MLDIRNLQIAAYAPDTSACGYYRIIIPLAYLHKYKICKRVTLFGAVELDKFADYDVIIAQRETRPTMVEDLKKLQSQGKIVLLDTDDMLESVHPSNPAYKIYFPGSPRLLNYMKAIKLSDALTVSTHELKKQYQGISKNIHVVPNYVDFDFRPWPQYEMHTKEIIRLGWSGSSSHLNDLKQIGGSLHKILNKYENVVYVHFGDNVLYNYILREFDLPSNKTIIIEPVNFDKYPASLNNFDIGLCPLVDSKFNRSKSFLKPLEYSACGIPFVASAVAPYMRYTDVGQDGFLVQTENEWIECISRLIEDKSLREKMSLQAYEKSKQYDWKDHLPEYIDTLNNAINNVPQINLPKYMSDSLSVNRNDICPCGSGLKAKKCNCHKFYC